MKADKKGVWVEKRAGERVELKAEERVASRV